MLSEGQDTLTSTSNLELEIIYINETVMHIMKTFQAAQHVMISDLKRLYHSDLIL